MALTERDKEQLLAEAFESKRVNFYCAKHNYMGPIKHRADIKPTLGCPNCWKIFYIHEMATTPPEERRQKLEEIEEVLHNMVQMVNAGTWDFKPYDHAQIEIGTE